MGKHNPYGDGMVCATLTGDSGSLYTNGQYVVACDGQGNETELLKLPMVTRVAVILTDE